MGEPPVYALSTAWNYKRFKDARDMAEEIRSLGFDSVELNFALTEAQVNDFIKLRDSGYLNITSAHNFCPLPFGVLPKNASPEYYALSSRDKEERALAVKFTKRSMDFAKRAGASALVLHLGRVEIKDRTKGLFALAGQAGFEKEKASVLFERKEKALPFMDAAIESLAKLLEHAGETGIDIGLENRYYIKEMPSFEEFKIIFDTLNDKHLFYPFARKPRL